MMPNVIDLYAGRTPDLCGGSEAPMGVDDRPAGRRGDGLLRRLARLADGLFGLAL